MRALDSSKACCREFATTSTSEMKDNYTQTTKNLQSAHNSYLRHQLDYYVYKQVQAGEVHGEFVSNSIIIIFWVFIITHLTVIYLPEFSLVLL